MIYDSYENLDFYKNLGIGGRYKKAVEFLQTTDLENLAPGKYEIDGKDVFANVVEYETIPWEDAKYEAHKNYTDIQYVITGEEIMSYAPVKVLTEKTEYDSVKDAVYFTNDVHGIDLLTKAGCYAIFNPWDGHKPKAMNGTPAPVKKVIVKINEK